MNVSQHEGHIIIRTELPDETVDLFAIFNSQGILDACDTLDEIDFRKMREALREMQPTCNCDGLPVVWDDDALEDNNYSCVGPVPEPPGNIDQIMAEIHRMRVRLNELES